MPNQRAKDRPRIMFVCSQKLADDLQERANRENRSRSNLIETLLTEVMEGRISQRDDKSLGFSATTLLKKLLQPMSDTDIILLSHDYDLDPKLLLEVRDRLSQKNGNL
jgi:metal-responsive CopG/Arc/MetJ family transcriptional regulator